MVEALMGLSYVGIPVLLLATGLVFGRWNEHLHYKAIKEREKIFSHVPATDLKLLPQGESIADSQLVQGSVVISVDYFKRVLAGIRRIFGGEIGSYAALVDRARREAILRMKESAPDADAFINCRIQTSTISAGNEKKIGSVEVLAYGTALRFRRLDHIDS